MSSDKLNLDKFKPTSDTELKLRDAVLFRREQCVQYEKDKMEMMQKIAQLEHQISELTKLVQNTNQKPAAEKDADDTEYSTNSNELKWKASIWREKLA